MYDDQIETYYLEKDYNCAESVLRILNDAYQLNLREEDFRLVGGFGGGCGCGLLCGALAGGIAALGSMQITKRAHVTPMFKELCTAYCGKMEQKLGSTDCAQIRPRCFREGVRCADVVQTALACFDELVKEQNLR